MPFHPELQQIDAVTDLYDRGLMVQAYRLASGWAPLKDWRGAAGRVAVGRLAYNIGAAKLGNLLHRLALRENPDDPLAIYYGARRVMDCRGPYFAWEFIQARGPLKTDDANLTADHLAFQALVLGWMRDFGRADDLMARALAIAPGRPWLYVEQANLLEREDRYPEALKSARRSLELHPWFRSGVQSVASILVLNNRDEDAIDLLSQATLHIESSPVLWQLALLQTELGRFTEARQTWDRVEALSPLMDKPIEQWLNARRSDAAYYCGDVPATIAYARKATSSRFHRKMADQLEQSQGEGKRVCLNVSFVRQHHKTCAPATLSALSAYWSRPCEHLALTDEICYDGTPAHFDRRWAEENGWQVREFSVTWTSAQALIDRGIPFTLTTTTPTTGHLQAVIGYDSLRGTLIIRDPYQRAFSEFICQSLLDDQQWSGPRGMAMMPPDQAHRLDGLELPEQLDYDDFYGVQNALRDHHRGRAAEAFKRLSTRSPSGRLVQQARRALAAYDGDVHEGLAAIEKLIELHPEPAALYLSKLSLVRILGSREDRLEVLNQLSGKKDAGPVALSQYAQELRSDAREHATAIKLLRRALRRTPLDAANYFLLACILWDQRQFEKGMELFRFATMLDDCSSAYGQAFFIASRHFKQTDQAISTMRARFERGGRRSADPARMLHWAYDEVGRYDLALKVIDEALALRGDDGDLLLWAADACARRGMFQQADTMLTRAENQSRRITWLRTAASVAAMRGDRPKACELSGEVVAAEPLNTEAHNHFAQLLSETRGRADAVAHIAAVAARFSHNYPLQQLWAIWLRDDGPAACEPILRRLIENYPSDGWARREIIFMLINARRWDEANAEVQILLNTHPHGAQTHDLHARILLGRGDRTGALASFRKAIAISVDADYTISGMMEACDTPESSREALAFVAKELERQTIFGDGLLAFRSHAKILMGPEEVLMVLREAHAARPDLWHAWSALIVQLTEMNQLAEATTAGVAALEYFPLQPALWINLAGVYRLNGQVDAEIDALNQAIAIGPADSAALRELAELKVRLGQAVEARNLLEQAVLRQPMDSRNHGCLADVLWKLGHKGEAVAAVRQSVKVDPAYSWGWAALARWSKEQNRPELAADLARDLTVTRAGEARSWMRLAEALSGQDHLDERLAALDRAIALSPRYVSAADLKVVLLAEAGRLREAEFNCHLDGFGQNQPTPIRARLAWLKARSGDFFAAITQMKQVLEEDPHHYWGWRQYVEWLQKQENYEEFLEATRKMVQRWPHDSPSHSLLGDACLAMNDPPGARIAFSRAATLSPDYEYAADQWFDLAFDDNDWIDAARAMDILERHAPAPRTFARRVQLAAKTGDRHKVVNGLLAIFENSTSEGWPIQTAIQAAGRILLPKDLDRMLWDAAHAPEAPAYLGEFVIERLVKSNSWKRAAELVHDLWANTDAGSRAAGAYVDHLVKKKKDFRLWRFIRKNKDNLRRNTLTWGKVGYALKSHRKHRQAIAWMSDWQSRKDATGWMLVNYASSLRALGRKVEANVVNVTGMNVDDGNARTKGIHTMWAAADHLFAGNLGEAERLLSACETEPTGSLYTFTRRLLHATLTQLQSEQPKATFSQTRNDITAARTAHKDFAKEREFRWLYLECLNHIVQQIPTFRVRLWRRSCWLSL